MIPNKLREDILLKINKTPRWFYIQLEQIRENLGYSFSREIAAYVFASENGIDPLPYIEGEQITEYRQAIQMRRTLQLPRIPITTTNPETRTEAKEIPTNPRRVVIQIPDLDEYEIPNLTGSTIADAAQMSKIYPVIYLFENSVREFIREVLDKRSPQWWDHVNAGIRKRVEDRKNTEMQNAYHGKTRVHPIQYVDFDDLRNIIQNNAKIFNDFMPDNNVEYIQQKLREVKDSRNILMHCNPLTETDMTRVRLYFTDWLNQLRATQEKLEAE